MEFLTLDPRPLAVTTARHWVLEACRRRELDAEASDAVELVTAEMVGNAVKHGRGRIVVTVGGSPPFTALLTGDAQVSPSLLAVSVTDGGTALPAPRRAGRDDVSGRGLGLVDALADSWGVTAVVARDGTSTAAGREAGKTTWALLDVRTGRTGAEG